MVRILSRHILWEFIPTFLVSMVFFTFIFLMSRVLEFTDYIVNYQVDALSVILLLVFIIPFFLQYIIPLSAMLAVLLTFLRMSGDLEIVALKAGGISMNRLLPPVVVFAVFCGLLTAATSIYALPYGRLASKQMMVSSASKHLDSQLKPRQFINSFKNVMLYIHDIDPDTRDLKDVFIEYRHSQDLVSTMTAPLGRIFVQPDQMAITLRLYNGNTFEVNAVEGAVIPGKFTTTDIRLDIQKTIRSIKDLPKDEEEMNLRELREYMERNKGNKNDQYYITQMEYYRKFSLPVACLVLSILAIPLGIQARSSKRSYGIGLGMLFFFLFYILLSVGYVFGEAGIYPPIIGMWLPDVVMGVIGFFFLKRAIQEKPILLPPIGWWFAKILNRWRK